MEKMSFAREVHANAGLTGRGNYFLISNASTRLDNCRNPCIYQDLKAVGEWEKRVGGCDRTNDSVASSCDRQSARIQSVDLTHANPNGGLIFSQQNRV
jgi:hypothetical protein